MFDATTIAKIEELARPQIHAAEGNEYIVAGDGTFCQIRPELDFVECLGLHSLDALVKMIQAEALELYGDSKIFIEASAYNNVTCFLRPDSALRNARPYIYEVKATDVPGWTATDALSFEEALISIRTRFQQTPDTEYLLRLLSEITNKAKVTYADNGVATSIVTQKGVALQSAEPIRPIVSLRPYRTFQEIEQPASEFHIRISERGIRFIEADGGMWKLAARKTITEYINASLVDEIEAGKVIVML